MGRPSGPCRDPLWREGGWHYPQPNQFDWTRELIRKQGLEHRVSVRLLDYREMEEREIYDKAVSVGMVEHVGHRNLGLYSARSPSS